MRPVKEADIQKMCLQYLTVVCKYFAWRNNTGAIAGEYKGKRRFVRYGAVGSADIFAVLPGGRFLSCEIKRPGNKPTAAQLTWRDAVLESGGLAVIVHSAEELRTCLRKAGYDVP